MTRLLFAILLITSAILIGLCEADGTSAAGDQKLVIEHINSFRTDPANARATIDKMLAAAYPNETERNGFLSGDADGKPRSEHINNFVAFASKQTKSAAIQWADELTGTAANDGKSNNKYFKPDLSFSLFDADPLKALLSNIGEGRDEQYKPLFDSGLKFGAIAARAAKNDEFQIALSSMPAKAFTLSDEEITAGAFDPRLDKEPAWVFSLNVMEPNVIPFVKSDGTTDVAWRRMSDKRVFVSRYSSSGSKVFTKEVSGVSDDYILLAGFTEDPAGNMYVARAIDEGDLDKKVEPSTPKDNKNNEFDRSEMMRLTKLDKDAKELWTKDFAKKGGGALAFFSPLSPKNNGLYGATSKLAHTTIKKVVYRLAADESVVVPANIAEMSILGFSINRLGQKSANRFAAKFQPVEQNGVLTPKVRLIFNKEYTAGKIFQPVGDDGKPVDFDDEGGLTSSTTIEYAAADYGKFNEFLDSAKEGEKEFYIAPEKLKLKASVEETPILFVLYGGATDFDPKPEFKARHQNAYWRVVDARTGEPIEGMNQGAMAHSFDYSLLVTDEGIISAERSDGFLLLANYMQTGQPKGPVFLPAFSTVSKDNECYCSVGGLAPASDGYMFLYAANNSKYTVTANRDDGVTDEQYVEEEMRQRDIGVLRAKKGFAQEIDAWGTKNLSVFEQIVDSRKKPAETNGMFLLRPKYITSYYRDGQPYSAGRVRFVRVAENQYVVFWERWNHVVSKSRDGNKELSGSYDSTWAMKIDHNGNIIKPATKISDTVRLMRGDEPVAWNGKAAFFTGDALTGKMMLHTIDGELRLSSQALDLK